MARMANLPENLPTPPQTFGSFDRNAQKDVQDVYVLLQRVDRDTEADECGNLERSETSRDVSLRTAPYVTVEFLKTFLIKKIPSLREVKPSQIRLVLRGTELKVQRNLQDYEHLLASTAQEPAIVGYYVRALEFKKAGGQVEKKGFQVDRLVPTSQGMKERINEVTQALAYNIYPRLTDDGTGGTYRMFNIRKTKVLAMFKPMDEEAYAPNNPRGFQKAAGSEGIRPGTYSTGGASREVAAYLLDHDGFACVPKTAHVHIKHEAFSNPRDETTNEVMYLWKTGSLQEFVQAHDTAGNMSSKQFSRQDVQRIAILDFRIINMDRNDGNILVTRVKPPGEPGSRWKLTPIDHGLSLADRLEVAEEDIVWMGWDQVKEPLGREERDYIRKLDYRKDAGSLFKSLAIPRNCLRLLWVAMRVLQLGVEADLTLHDLGKLMYRQDFEEPSRLQVLIEAAVDTASFYSKSVGLSRNSPAPSRALADSLNIDRPRLQAPARASRDFARGASRDFSKEAQLSLSPTMSASEASEFSTTPPASMASLMLPSPRDSVDLSDSPSDQTEDWTQGGGTAIRLDASGTAIRTGDTGTAIRTGDTGTAIRTGDTGTEVRLHVEAEPRAKITTKGKRAQPGQVHLRADGGIFSKPDDKGSETLVWDETMDHTFRRHVEQGILAEIKKITQRKAAEAQ